MQAIVWSKWILAVSLALLGIQDLRERKVWIWGTFPAAGIQMGGLLYQREFLTVGAHMLGMAVVTGGLVLCRKLLGKRFGSGDIWITAGICLTCGATMTGAVCLVGLALAAVLSALLLAGRRVHLSTRIPFVPFLAAAYWICIWI